MKYTKKELGFILYNNRSVKGVVKNFFPKNIDILKLNQIEKKLDWSKSGLQDNRFVEIDLKELNSEADDVFITKKDVISRTELLINSHKNISQIEFKWLINRGISQEIINKWKLGSLSFIKNKKDLEVLGVTIHPILTSFLEDNLNQDGILIPLYENDKLINCACRRISSSQKLKYTLACPDVDVWGLTNNSHIWIVEGLFDMMALKSVGINAVSVSSAMWSSIQLYKLLETKPTKITIWSDKDQVGLRTSMILQRFFNLNMIPCNTVISEFKDSAEHIFENKRSLNEIKEINITKDMIKEHEDESFDFLKYLKNRKY